MSGFLNNIFDSLFKRARPRPANQRRRRTTLRVESLEERALFSVTPSMPFPDFSEGTRVASAEFDTIESTGVVQAASAQSSTQRGGGGDILVFDIVDDVARAGSRWEQIITGDLPDATYQGSGSDINDDDVFRSPENADPYKNFKFVVKFDGMPAPDIDDPTIDAVITGMNDVDPAARLTIGGSSISDVVRGFNGRDVLIGGQGGDAAGSSLGSEYKYVPIRRFASSTFGDGSVRLVSPGVTSPTADADPFTAADDVVVDSRVIPGDDNNHGTHVAGTIGAMGNNAIDYGDPDLYLNVWINQSEAGASDDFLNADSESDPDSDGTAASSGYIRVKKLNTGG